MHVSMHGHVFPSFPALHGRDVPPEVRRDFFPRIEPVPGSASGGLGLDRGRVGHGARDCSRPPQARQSTVFNGRTTDRGRRRALRFDLRLAVPDCERAVPMWSDLQKRGCQCDEN
jgi:hypothetical protein